MAFHWLRFVKGPPGSRQLPFGPGTKTCMRPVIQRDRFGGSGHAHLLSCCLSAAAVGFLSRPVPATGFRLLPTGGRSFPPDRDKVPTFRTYELRPVPGAPFTPGSWCSPGRILDSSQHCRLPAADPLPQKSFHRRGLASRGLQGFTLFALPDFPSPAAGGWITGSWDSSRCFAPRSAVACGARREQGRVLSTHPELPADHLDPPSQIVHSQW